MTYEDFLYSLSSDQQAAIVADYRSLRHDHCPPVQAMTSAIDALLYEELPIEGTPSASTIDRLYTIAKQVMEGQYANLSEALSAFSSDSDLNHDTKNDPATQRKGEKMKIKLQIFDEDAMTYLRGINTPLIRTLVCGLESHVPLSRAAEIAETTALAIWEAARPFEVPDGCRFDSIGSSFDDEEEYFHDTAWIGNVAIWEESTSQGTHRLGIWVYEQEDEPLAK